MLCSFFEYCVSIENECMSGEPRIIFYFCNVTVNKLQKTPPKILTDLKMIMKFPNPCQGKLAGGTHFMIFWR